MAVREVWAQCQLAQAAYGLMQAVMGPPVERPFVTIQALLSHSANVSKMLDAEQERRRLTGIEQRLPRWCRRLLRTLGFLDSRPTIGDMLGIADISIVHKDGRRFRNDLEHYDERLLRWLRRVGPKGNIMDFNIAPKGGIVFPGAIVVRHLDPSTHHFTFSGKDLDLKLLIDELQHIQGIANAWLRARGYP